MSNSSHKPIFGMFIPQGWKMELSSIEGAENQWNRAVEIAVRAEELGFDSLWVYDHFHNVPRPSQEAVFECWTTIAAISQRTSTIRLGQMVGCNSYRNPGLLAKITSTIDVISGGRLEWGIGAGWYESEYKGYGFEFAKPSDRIGMLKETVEIVKSMWTQSETTYDGKYYKLSRANCDPKPLQKPNPPIWIGGGGEQLTLRVVAQHADVSNFGSSLEEFIAKREILKGHCAAIGRDEDTIRKTISSEVFIRETEQEVIDAGCLNAWGGDPEQWRQKALVGTPEQVSEKIQKYLDAGCTGFVPWCPDYPSTETMELFATKVIPNFR